MCPVLNNFHWEKLILVDLECSSTGPVREGVGLEVTGERTERYAAVLVLGGSWTRTPLLDLGRLLLRSSCKIPV